MGSIVYFEVDNALYGVEAEELTGVGSECPVVIFPEGLTSGAPAAVLWGGQVFPVHDYFGVGRDRFKACVYLFTSEFAVPVPSRLQVSRSQSKEKLVNAEPVFKLPPKYAVRVGEDKSIIILELNAKLIQQKVMKHAA